MKPTPIDTDERTFAITNASYRWGYLFLSFAILVVVGYRSFAFGQSSWDLIAIVVLGGVVTTAYQQAHRILSRRTAAVALLVGMVALLVAMAIAVM